MGKLFFILFFINGILLGEELPNSWADNENKIVWRFMGKYSSLTANGICEDQGTEWHSLKIPHPKVQTEKLFKSFRKMLLKSFLADKFDWLEVEERGKMASMWINDSAFLKDKAEAANNLRETACEYAESELLSPNTKALCKKLCDDYEQFSLDYKEDKIGVFLFVMKTDENVLITSKEDLTGLRGGLCRLAKRWDKNDCIDFYPAMPAEKNTDDLDTVCFKLIN